jgi:hypothetical protein
MTQVMEFTIPEGADAIYFGLSVCASHPTEGYNVYYAQFQSHTADQVKVINMLGTQAILYLSRRYKEAAIKAMDTCIEKGGFNDIALSRIQPQFNIYANKVPTFYQSNKFNQIEQGFDVEKATKITINNNLSISFGIIQN